MSRGALWPLTPAHLGRSTPNALHGESHHTDQPVGAAACPLNTRVKTRHVMHFCGCRGSGYEGSLLICIYHCFNYIVIYGGGIPPNNSW